MPQCHLKFHIVWRTSLSLLRVCWLLWCSVRSSFIEAHHHSPLGYFSTILLRWHAWACLYSTEQIFMWQVEVYLRFSRLFPLSAQKHRFQKTLSTFFFSFCIPYEFTHHPIICKYELMSFERMCTSVSKICPVKNVKDMPVLQWGICFE